MKSVSRASLATLVLVALAAAPVQAARAHHRLASPHPDATGSYGRAGTQSALVTRLVAARGGAAQRTLTAATPTVTSVTFVDIDPQHYDLLVYLSENGDVAGNYDDLPSGVTHGFRWTTSSGWSALPDLAGAVGSSNSSFVGAISDSGLIVGGAATRAGEQHPVVWPSADVVTDLGTLGGTTGFASSANRRGDVAGWSQTATGDEHAFLWTAGQGMRDLGTLGGPGSRALGINRSDMVVGTAQTVTGAWHPFLWTAGDGMSDLGTLGMDEGSAFLVNDKGVVAGNANASAGLPSRAFRWTARTGLVDLGTVDGGTSSWASGIDAAGDVAGGSSATHSASRAFVWTRQIGMLDLIAGYADAIGMSPRGWVTGEYSANDGMHAYRWSARTGVQDLPRGDSRWVIGTDVNDRGQVIGLAEGADGLMHARLWTSR